MVVMTESIWEKVLVFRLEVSEDEERVAWVASDGHHSRQYYSHDLEMFLQNLELVSLQGEQIGF